MNERRIYVTEDDLTRLETLIASRALSAWGRDGRLDDLSDELDRAEVLGPDRDLA